MNCCKIYIKTIGDCRDHLLTFKAIPEFSARHGCGYCVLEAESGLVMVQLSVLQRRAAGCFFEYSGKIVLIVESEFE